jgi:hypothetical protein
VSGYSPFADHHGGGDQMVICRNILRGDFEFPPYVKDKDVSLSSQPQQRQWGHARLRVVGAYTRLW